MFELPPLPCSAVVERLNSLLPSSLSRLHSNLASVQSQIHASPESPAWDQFLRRAEQQVMEGLVTMVLTAVSSLLHRAQLYEQVLYTYAVQWVSNLLLKTIMKETNCSTMEVQFAWEM